MIFHLPFREFIQQTILRNEFKDILKQEKIHLVIKNIHSDYFSKNKFNSYIGKNIFIKDYKKIMNDYYIIFINSNYIEQYLYVKAICRCFMQIYTNEFINIILINILYKIIYKMHDDELIRFQNINFINVPELTLEEFKQITIDSLLNKPNLEELYGDKYKEYKRKKEYYMNKYKEHTSSIIMSLHKMIK